MAGGTDPLSYQWRFNGTALSGATDPDLVLTDVQSANSGSYSVLVSNAWGQAVSTNAVLEVYSPSCVLPPDGLAAWWAAEGNAYDSLCQDNGTPTAASPSPTARSAPPSVSTGPPATSKSRIRPRCT